MPFAKLKDGNVIQYKLNGPLTQEMAEAVHREIKTDLVVTPTVEAFVLDLQDHELDYSCFKVFTPLALDLRKRKLQIYSVSSNSANKRLIMAQGLDKILKPLGSIKELKENGAPAKGVPRMDVNFINPFIDGTIHVLKVQASTEVTPGKPALNGKEALGIQIDIAGVIGLTSKAFNGSISICFPEKVFLSIMSKMLGEEFTELTADLEDGASELLNMIFGHAKKVLNEKGHTIERALPSVARAPNLVLSHAGSQGAITLPFTTESGTFYMEISTEDI